MTVSTIRWTNVRGCSATRLRIIEREKKRERPRESAANRYGEVALMAALFAAGNSAPPGK